METWPASLPFWTTAYSVGMTPAMLRDDAQKGAISQRRVSHRKIEMLDAKLGLFGVQLGIFEHFIRDLNKEGTAIFQGPYKKGDAFLQGKIRIVDGAYKVNFVSAHVYSVTCLVEILS
jgi:hypothetical protein